MRAWGRLLAVLVVVLAAGGVVADPFHRANVLVGERAAGMGGAFTALADDGSAGHYNPAGLAMLPGESFSLSSNLYGVRWESVGGSANVHHFDFFDFQSIPGATATVKELYGGTEDEGLYRLVGAFSLFVTDHESSSRNLVLTDVEGRTEQGAAVHFDRFLVTSERSQQTLEAAVSLGFHVTRWLDIGMSALVLYRTEVRDELSDAAADEADDSRVLRLHLKLDGKYVGIAGAFGIHAEPLEGLHVGANFRTPPARVYSAAQTGGTFWVDGGAASVQRFPDADVDMDYRPPAELAFGVAYELPRVFAVSADLSLRMPMVSYVDIEDEDFGRVVDRNFAWDVALGAEGYPVEWFAIRAGFFTNNSSGGPADPTFNPSPAVDELGVSTGVGFAVGDTTISGGVIYWWGDGEVLPLGRFGDVVLDRSVSVLRVVFAGSYHY